MLAVWGVEALLALAPADLPRLQNIGIDWRVLGWTALVSLLSGILFSLAPALQSSRLDLNESLKEGGRSGTEGFGKRRLRRALVVAEIALALVLLVSSGLLIRSFRLLQQVDAGVNAERVLTMELSPRYPDAAQRNNFYQRLVERVKALPGVETAAVSNSLPPDKLPFSDGFLIDGRLVDPNIPQIGDAIRCSPEYFRALGTRLRRGRYFNESETNPSPPVAIINETLARQFFPNEDPIGKRIRWDGPIERNPWMQVIGVVGDVKYRGLRAEVQPIIYEPAGQSTWWGGMNLIIRTKIADPLSLVAAARNEVRELDRDVPVAQTSTLEQRFDQSVAPSRFTSLLLTVFGLVALTLASVGIYGVMAYTVSERKHEIGIRMALGAQTRDVLKLVMRQGVTLALIGMAIGTIASLALTRLMKTLLFGVSATDPLTFGVITALLIIVALLACWIPARRATKVDPMIALRCE